MRINSLASFAVISLFFCLVSPAVAQRQPLDIRKAVIESPVKKIIRSSTDISGGRFESPLRKLVGGAADLGKADIEGPVKKVIGASGSPVDNPKVDPGRVRWHNTFALACAASRSSGRPVLLFQMMGNLDDEFC